jgi:hypothetical protein
MSPSPQGHPVEPDTELVPVELVVAEMVAKSVWGELFDGGFRIFEDAHGIDRIDAGPDQGMVDLVDQPQDLIGKVSVWFSRASLMPVRSSRGSTADLVMAVA